MPDTAFMPRYQSHKIVSALEIASIDWTPNAISTAGQMQGGWTIMPADPGFENIKVDANFTARFMPKPGDFVVWYEDGYMSASPRKAFLEGYTRLGTSDSDVNPMPQTKDFRGVATEIKHMPPDRSLTSRDLEDLRKWAVLMAIDAHKHDVVPAKDIVGLAAELERYVLDGVPPKIVPVVQDLPNQGQQGQAQQSQGPDKPAIWR